MTRILLVHGAFGGAWCWSRVVDPLERAGHTVEALDLPGGGDDRTPPEQVTLEACAAPVCDALAASSEPALLVGHSMGGVVVTQAASNRPDRVLQLAFVCAFMPADGRSLLDLTRLPEGQGDQIELDADHAPFLSAANELAGALLEFASERPDDPRGR